MKKAIVIALTFVLIVSMTGCKEEESPYADILAQIYEVDVGYHISTGHYGKFVHNNVIPSEGEVFYEYEVGTKRIYQTELIDATLEYASSSISWITGEKAHRYNVTGYEGSTVWLNEDGQLDLIRHPIVKIDRDPSDTKEDVQAMLEKQLSDIVDFSEYEFVKLPGGDEPTMNFTYYNEINGYRGSYMSINVRGDGTVDYLEICSRLNQADLMKCSEVDEQLLRAVIDAKMKSIYNTEVSECTGYEIEDRIATRYYGELCVLYQMHTYVKFLDDGTEDWPHTWLLIPVRLLTETP